jgi:hypothetical protein
MTLWRWLLGPYTCLDKGLKEKFMDFKYSIGMKEKKIRSTKENKFCVLSTHFQCGNLLIQIDVVLSYSDCAKK